MYPNGHLLDQAFQKSNAGKIPKEENPSRSMERGLFRKNPLIEMKNSKKKRLSGRKLLVNSFGYLLQVGL